MITFTGMVSMLRDFLQVPLGAKYRKANSNGDSDSMNYRDISQIDFIQSILSITVDDVCIGTYPLFYKTQTEISPIQKAMLDELTLSVNSEIRNIAWDLLSLGYSAYKVHVDAIKKRVFLYPQIDDNPKIVLSRDKKLKYFKDADGTTPESDILLFCNYIKMDMTPCDDDNLAYVIEPRPIQLANIRNTVRDLLITDQSILSYRRQLSKVVRFATVEVGASQGDQQQTVVDNISEGLNANSSSLEAYNAPDTFDDQIPVFPTRKGIGEPKLTTDIPNFDIGQMKDLDYDLSKIFLGMKFPKTYSDFQEALSPTAVSLIRGDVRYSRMIKATRAIIEQVLNDKFSTLISVIYAGVQFKLTEIPSSEDDDVITSLSGYTDFLTEANEFIFGAEPLSEVDKIEQMRILLGNSANLPSVERWLNYLEGIASKRNTETSVEGEDSDLGLDLDQGIESSDISPDEESDENQPGIPTAAGDVSSESDATGFPPEE